LEVEKTKLKILWKEMMEAQLALTQAAILNIAKTETDNEKRAVCACIF
jgi:hypothetical protein